MYPATWTHLDVVDHGTGAATGAGVRADHSTTLYSLTSETATAVHFFTSRCNNTFLQFPLACNFFFHFGRGRSPWQGIQNLLCIRI